ncbi:putative 1-phosphatidylinositol-4-phosphate 5-kinase [Corchorus olitorius]|uniref:1-phosphatidylinositol-4-phosphate 5-kinase n=1 Tax=Corchorus olitorius TaxID=93759 RepID=A0A1R3JUV8_9ROSI|nr:putative 1-phosphatidylinositol-4-phosphate 5-kinase [Corchorus olitorius]
MEASLPVTKYCHIEEQVSQKSSISTRLAQHFPSVFNFLRRHPSSSNDTNGNDFKVMKKTDSNKMENKVPVEGISGGFDDSGEIQNAPNVRSSDIYSLRDYDSGSDQNEAPLLPGTSDSSGYYDEITEVISTSHREPLSGWSLGPGHQLAQDSSRSWGASSDSSFEVMREFYNTASTLLKGKTDIPKKQGVLSVRAASMPRDEVQRRGVYKGRCQGGLPEGKGRLVLGDGSIYDGRRYGKRSGAGTFYFSNRDVFQGSWRDDLMHGKLNLKVILAWPCRVGFIHWRPVVCKLLEGKGQWCIEIWDEGVLVSRQTLPVELTQLLILEKLYLDNNKLSVLPPELGELKTLKVLGVDYSMLVLVGKRGIEKQPFQRTYFTATGIEKIIHGHIEKETKATGVYIAEDGRNGFCLSDVYCWQDGAIVAKNPNLFTIRRAQLLWPDTNIDCLVSICCGSFTYKDIISYWRIKFRDFNFLKERKGGWRYVDTGQVLIESACSVDGVEEALSTLLPMLPEIQYFQFNPVYFQLRS